MTPMLSQQLDQLYQFQQHRQHSGLPHQGPPHPQGSDSSLSHRSSLSTIGPHPPTSPHPHQSPQDSNGSGPSTPNPGTPGARQYSLELRRQ